jgi:hypothetical protein
MTEAFSIKHIYAIASNTLYCKDYYIEVQRNTWISHYSTTFMQKIGVKRVFIFLYTTFMQKKMGVAYKLVVSTYCNSVLSTLKMH